MSIPIIVLNWNGIEDTIECISSIRNMTNQNYHIYLVDNFSLNSEGQKLEDIYSNQENISVYQNDENLGFTKAHIKIWEEEISKKSAKFLVLLNNDTAVDPHWLEQLVDFAEKENADIVSSKMIDYNQRHLMDNAGHQMLNTGEIIPIGHSEPIEGYDEAQGTMGACAGACLIRSSVIEHIGFFDSYFSTGYEDAEFGLRAIIAGYKILYNPKAIVYHKRGQSIKKVFNNEYSVMIQTSILYSYFKLVPLLNILISIPSIIFKNLSIVIIDILFGRWSYLYTWKESWKRIIKSRKIIREKRKEFYSTINKNHINAIQFMRKTRFFLGFDIERFWRIIILNKKSALDQY